MTTVILSLDLRLIMEKWIGLPTDINPETGDFSLVTDGLSAAYRYAPRWLTTYASECVNRIPTQYSVSIRKCGEFAVSLSRA